jgi:hypothetical protein
MQVSEMLKLSSRGQLRGFCPKTKELFSCLFHNLLKEILANSPMWTSDQYYYNEYEFYKINR